MEHSSLYQDCKGGHGLVLAPSGKDIENNASITSPSELQNRSRVARPRLFAFVVLVAVLFYWAYHVAHRACHIQTHGHYDIDPSGLALQGLKQHPIKPDANICLTPACVHASSELLYNLSPDYQNLDPCTDFEELVCGGWRDRHDLRPDQGDAFTGTIMSENSDTLLRHTQTPLRTRTSPLLHLMLPAAVRTRTTSKSSNLLTTRA
jgi:hypothetical protein